MPPNSDDVEPQKRSESAELDFDEQTGSGPLRAFFGLFLVPLLVVLVCVGVFVGFGWIAYDHQDTQDYLNDLRSSWKPRRAQAAYELSKILIADPEALAGQPEVAVEVRRLFKEAEDPEIQRYLALVLGYTRDAGSVALLTNSLDNESDSQTRIYLLWALGAIGDPGASSALIGHLSSDDPGLRKVAAYALGRLGDPAVAPRLEPLLEDRIADVRWNAALSVSYLDSNAGLPVLAQMLDRSMTSRVPDITPEQQEETMIAALGALARVGRAAELRLLDDLVSSDPSYRVRQAAIEARKLVQGRG